MPIVELPMSEEEKGRVDVIALLMMVLSGDQVDAARNGPHLWLKRNLDRSVTMSAPLAAEVTKLAATYRYYFRVMQWDPNKKPGLTMQEWSKFRDEAEELARALDKIYPDR